MSQYWECSGLRLLLYVHSLPRCFFPFSWIIHHLYKLKYACSPSSHLNSKILCLLVYKVSLLGVRWASHSSLDQNLAPDSPQPSLLPTLFISGTDTVVQQATNLGVIFSHLLFSNLMSSNPINFTFNIYPKFDHFSLSAPRCSPYLKH